MKLPSLRTDNITELLAMIIRFTQARQDIVTDNINKASEPGFTPRDLAVKEFAKALNIAINECLLNDRLLLCDSENIKFGPNRQFEAAVVIDEHALEILDNSRDKYIEFQLNKMLENSLNQRLAAELLR